MSKMRMSQVKKKTRPVVLSTIMYYHMSQQHHMYQLWAITIGSNMIVAAGPREWKNPLLLPQSACKTKSCMRNTGRPQYLQGSLLRLSRIQKTIKEICGFQTLKHSKGDPSCAWVHSEGLSEGIPNAFCCPCHKIFRGNPLEGSATSVSMQVQGTRIEQDPWM